MDWEERDYYRDQDSESTKTSRNTDTHQPRSSIDTDDGDVRSPHGQTGGSASQSLNLHPDQQQLIRAQPHYFGSDDRFKPPVRRSSTRSISIEAYDARPRPPRHLEKPDSDEGPRPSRRRRSRSIVGHHQDYYQRARSRHSRSRSRPRSFAERRWVEKSASRQSRQYRRSGPSFLQHHSRSPSRPRLSSSPHLRPQFWPVRERSISPPLRDERRPIQTSERSAYTQVESKGLSKTYTLPLALQQAKYAPKGPVISEWDDFVKDWDEGDLNLHLVRASEYSLYRDGKEKVNLVCSDQTDDISTESSTIQMKWVHLQRPCLNPQILQKLILRMPFISQELRQVARTLLDDIQKPSPFAKASSNGYPSQATCAFRSIGKREDEERSETEPVIFLSSPYLLLTKRTSLSDSEKGHEMTTLLQSLYGFDIGKDQPTKEVVRKMNIGLPEDTLHTPKLWYLLLGSDILVTFSELSLPDLFGDLIVINTKSSQMGRLMTIRVMDQKSRRFNVVIDVNSNYVDFLRDAVALIRQPGYHATDYELFDESITKVTPQDWLKLLKNGKLETKPFYVIPKPRVSSTPKKVDYYLAPPRAEAYINRRLGTEAKKVTFESYDTLRSPRSRSPSSTSAVARHDLARNGPVTGLRPGSHEVEKSADNTHREARNMQLVQRSRTRAGEHGPHENFTIDPRWLQRPYVTRPPKSSLPFESRKHSSERQLIPLRPLPQYSPTQDFSRRQIGRDETYPTPDSDTSHRIRPGNELVINDRALSAPRPSVFSLDGGLDNTNSEALANRNIPTQDLEVGNVQSARQTERVPIKRAQSVSSVPTPSSSPHPITYDGPQSSNHGIKSYPEDEYPRKGRIRIPAHLVSIQAIQDFGYPFRIQDDEIVIPKGRGMIHLEELINLSEQYQKSLPVARDTHRPFFTWASRADNDWTNVPDLDTTAIRVLSRLHKMVSYGKVGRLYDQTIQCTMEDLIQRHDLFDKKPKESDTEERRILVVTVEVDSDGESVDEEPQTIREFVFDDEAEGSENVRRVTIESADEDSGEEKQDTSRSFPRESPVSNGIFPVSATDASRDAPRANESQDAQQMPVDKHMSSDKTLPIDSGSKPVETTAAMQNGQSSRGEETDAEAIGGKDNSPTGSSEKKFEPIAQNYSPKPFRRNGVVLKRLVEVSREIFWDFVPREGSVLVHQVSKKYWGSLDDILRQVVWSSTQTEHPIYWKIREFPPSIISLVNSPLKAFSDCQDCLNHVHYDSHHAALDHLHSKHLQCSKSHKDNRPFDDPCFVWLEASEHSDRETLLPHIEHFINSLLDIKELTHEIHCLIAKPSYNRSTLDTTLSLPTKVVYAFEEIILMHMMMARQLSIMNRDEGGRKRFERIAKIQDRRRLAQRSACDLLESAQADVISLGTAPRNFDILGLDAIGPEFLVGALAINLQNRPLLPGTDTGIVEVYLQYISKLRYQASRRPQRRIFFEIHSLQSELEALSKLISSQKSVLEDYRDLLSPSSYRITNATRQGLFEIESRYINAQLTTLSTRHGQVQALRDQAAILKEQVKQMIEILEEGHGKAIRVFTVVTLFFLPLSFTSSFFGMNTTDIRDIEANQRIFWVISIPVTIGVLALAFMYGYKGDEIQDTVISVFHSTRMACKDRLIIKEEPRRAETFFSMTSGARGAAIEQPAYSNNYFRFRRWRHTGAVDHRKGKEAEP